MLTFRSQLFYGVFLGVLLLLFFIAIDANAMVIDNTGEIIRDTDIIATKLEIQDIGNQYAKIQYLDSWKDTINIDEIHDTWERTGNVYTTYSGKQYHKDSDLWFTVGYATTTLAEFNKADLSHRGFLRYIIPTVNAQWTVYPDSEYYWNENCTPCTWDQAHDSSDANIGGSGVLQTGVNVVTVGSKNPIQRMFLAFYTGFIEDNDIESAYLKLTPSLIAYNNDQYIVIVDADSISSSSPATTDFDLVGDAIDDPTEYAPRQHTLSSAAVDTELTFTLYATSTDFLATTTWSKIGLRLQYDAEDNSVPYDTTADDDYVHYYTTAESGTVKDPKLEITLATSSPPADPATSTSATAGSLEIFNDIAVISGYVEIYTDSTTTPSETRHIIYHVPFLVWLVFWLIFSTILTRIILEIIIRSRRRSRK